MRSKKSKKYDLIIPLDKFKQILNNEKTYFSHKPIQLGKNIFNGHIFELMKRNKIEPKDFNYSAILNEDIKDMDIFITLLESKHKDINLLMKLFINEILKT